MTEEQLKTYLADVKSRFENLEEVVRKVEEFIKQLGHVPSGKK